VGQVHIGMAWYIDFSHMILKLRPKQIRNMEKINYPLTIYFKTGGLHMTNYNPIMISLKKWPVFPVRIQIHFGEKGHQIFQHLRRSEEHTSELQSRFDLVCRLLLEKKNIHDK